MKKVGVPAVLRCRVQFRVGNSGKAQCNSRRCGQLTVTQCVVFSTSCSVFSILSVWYTLLCLAGGELLPRRLSRFPALWQTSGPGNAFLLCVLLHAVCLCVSTTCCVGAVTYSHACSQGCYMLLYVGVLTPVYGRATCRLGCSCCYS